MSDTLSYPFEEIPLVSESGFVTGFVDGEIEIRYHYNGDWGVRAIRLDGFKDGAWIKNAIEIDEGSELYLNLFDHFTRGDSHDRIQDKVNELLDQENVVHLSDYAQHNTHHSALSGVA
jgi:hypothetical protein